MAQVPYVDVRICVALVAGTYKRIRMRQQYKVTFCWDTEREEKSRSGYDEEEDALSVGLGFQLLRSLEKKRGEVSESRLG